jgi:hypothetical protein
MTSAKQRFLSSRCLMRALVIEDEVTARSRVRLCSSGQKWKMHTIILCNLGLTMKNASKGVHPRSIECAQGIYGLAALAYLNDRPETCSWTA